MKKITLTLFLLSVTVGHSQVILSLIFGDKLNSPNLEFGLDGGVNFSDISNLEHEKITTDFNLGFYFDIKLKKHPSWMINTGVIVKSSMGADKLPIYSLNNENLDATFADGYVNRTIKYFNVPIMIKYKFDNNIFVKAGTQLGLLSRAYDEFYQSYDGEDAQYKNNIRDQIHVIDAGFAVGVGYRLTAGNGMNLGMQYYNGLVPVMKGDGPNQYNRSFYITAGIPIGKGKAAKQAAAKKAAEEKAALPADK